MVFGSCFERRTCPRVHSTVNGYVRVSSAANNVNVSNALTPTKLSAFLFNIRYRLGTELTNPDQY